MEALAFTTDPILRAPLAKQPGHWRYAPEFYAWPEKAATDFG